MAAMVKWIYVMDGATLIDNIHELKQWIYNDVISIHIPGCTLALLDQSLQLNSAPKETVKVPVKKFGKPSRVEHPLFDINPRTTKEFLTRAQAERYSSQVEYRNPDHGVTFQLPEEAFTQWQQEDQAALAGETPEAPPTSFAAALLRKLHINDASNAHASKASSKPKLVARASSPKSPWKAHKIPYLSAEGIAEEAKKLLSCVLWRLHEYENNPLLPEHYILLTDTRDVAEAAERLGVPFRTTNDVRQAIFKQLASEDCRHTVDQLQADFGDIVEARGHIAAQRAGLDSMPKDAPVEDNKEMANAAPGAGVGQELDRRPSHVEAKDQDSKAYHEYLFSVISVVKSMTDDGQVGETVSTTLEEVNRTLHQVMAENLPPSTAAQSPEKAHELQSSPLFRSNEQAEVLDSSSDDSDEEVIVFTPKSKRVSAPSQKPLSSPLSHITPLKDSSPTNTPPKDILVEAPLLKQQREKSDLKADKPRIASTLRPESPVFTPANLAHLPMASIGSTLGNLTSATTLRPRLSSSPKKQHSRRSPINVRAEKVQEERVKQESPSSRRPRSIEPSQVIRQIPEQAHHQGSDMIQRQREAIQRVTQAVRPPPRQIQMEPTANPAVIDPDAFDRSYVVQPRSDAGKASHGNAARLNSKSRSTSRPVTRDGPRVNASLQRPRSSRTSPKGKDKTQVAAEADVDYVLKSGTPRGSIRGKGKLWIP